MNVTQYKKIHNPVALFVAKIAHHLTLSLQADYPHLLTNASPTVK